MKVINDSYIIYKSDAHRIGCTGSGRAGVQVTVGTLHG